MKTMKAFSAFRGLTTVEVGGLLAASALLAGLALPRATGTAGLPAWSVNMTGTVRTVSVAHDAWEAKAGQISASTVLPVARKAIAPAGVPAVSYGDADLSRTGPAATTGSAGFDTAWTEALSVRGGDRDGQAVGLQSRGFSTPDRSDSASFRGLTAGVPTIAARDASGPR